MCALLYHTTPVLLYSIDACSAVTHSTCLYSIDVCFAVTHMYVFYWCVLCCNTQHLFVFYWCVLCCNTQHLFVFVKSLFFVSKHSLPSYCCFCCVKDVVSEVGAEQQNWEGISSSHLVRQDVAQTNACVLSTCWTNTSWPLTYYQTKPKFGSNRTSTFQK